MNRILLFTGAALALTACGSEHPEQVAPDLPPVSVTVSGAVQAVSDASQPARIVPRQEADVATRMAGTVARMAVRVGDRVSAGTLLATLDATDVNARIEAAEAQAALAEKTHRRVENLAADGAASQQELDQARAQVESARAVVKEARAQAAYVEIRAPFAGVVTARMADPGDLANPGQPLIQLSGDAVKVVAELPAGMAGAVREGDRVRIVTDRGAVPGTVQRVVPALNRSSRRFQIEVEPETREGLLTGAFARLQMAGEGESTRWIPADAVIREGQLTGVYSVERDSLRLRWIRLGRTRGEAVEVLAGPPGDLTVVRSPDGDLRDGQPVSGTSVEPWSVETTGGPTDPTQGE